MDLLREISWLGTFFIPGSDSDRFAGRLEYTPGEGVVLRYLLTNNLAPRYLQTRYGEPYLFGTLDSGERCTLFEAIGTIEKSKYFRGPQISESGAVAFEMMVLGAHVPPNQKFDSATVTYSGMQEFFFSAGFKAEERFSPDLSDTERTGFGSVSIFTPASFEYLPNDPIALFYSSDPDTLKALEIAFEDIKKRFPDQMLQIKRDIEYALHLDFAPSLQLRDIRLQVIDLANLLALLLHNPVLPQRVMLESQATPHEHIKVFLSLPRDRRTVDMCLEDTSHHRLPINAKNIKLPKLIGKWLESSEQFRTIADSLQHQTGVINLRDLHGELVLNVALLESISQIMGRRSQREKYQFPVDRFSSHWVTELLSNELGVQASQIGEAISNLRNEIVHFGKPRELLCKLELSGLYRVNVAIRLVVLGYVLSHIGIPMRIIHAYQGTFMPYCVFR